MLEFLFHGTTVKIDVCLELMPCYLKLKSKLKFYPSNDLLRLDIYRPQRNCGILSTGGGVCPSACWDTQPFADTPQADTPSRQPQGDTPDGHCSGRYTSYWNAFLLVNKINLLFLDNFLN